MSKDALEEQFDNERPVQARPRRLADWINPTGAKKNHSLIDKVYQKENLSTAWERVKENRGSGGVDRQSVAGFEAQCDQQLDRLQQELCGDCYQPQPVRQAPIPKAGKPGEFRAGDGREAVTAPQQYQRCTTAYVNKRCCSGWNRSSSLYSTKPTSDIGEGGRRRMPLRKCGRRLKAEVSELWTRI